MDHSDRSVRPVGPVEGTGLTGLYRFCQRCTYRSNISSEVGPMCGTEFLGGSGGMYETSSFVRLMLAEPGILIMGSMYVGVIV